jgi:hypothetical protein
LQTFFGTPDMLESINDLCSVKNAIKKSERRHFAYSHVANLLSYYLICSSADIKELKAQIDGFATDPKESLYYVAGFLSSVRQNSLTPAESDRLKALVEDLAGRKLTAESYRHATLLLALQNVCKTFKLRIENSKYDSLENQCAGLVSAKNLSKFFEEIVVDDTLNTSLNVPFFDEAVANILARNNEKAIGKLFKFFLGCIDAVQKDKNQRQKKAFHLVNFLKSLLVHLDPQILLEMDIDQSLARHSNSQENSEPSTMVDIFVDLLAFWVKQFGNKNPESKKAATEIDHALATKIKQAEKAVGSKLCIFLLKILKNTPTNSLRGGDLKLMSTILGFLYQDDKAFQTYFQLLLKKVQESSKVSELNFYLNELEHLGQISLTAKNHKELDGEREATLRCSVLKTLVEIYLHCEDEASLDSYFGGKHKLEWNEQDLSFRKFRTKIFERILNLVFKREDALLLTKAASLYGTLAGEQDPEVKVFFKKTLESASKSSKEHAELGNLQRALVFQNVFEDDVSKNADIVSDIIASCQLISQKDSPAGSKRKAGSIF